MNPLIDAGLLFVVVLASFALCYEVPRAVYNIRAILSEALDD
jgi:hypothetical protein